MCLQGCSIATRRPRLVTNSSFSADRSDRRCNHHPAVVVQPADVVKNPSGYPRAEAVLKYDASARSRGLRYWPQAACERRVDVSASRAAR